MSLGYSKTSLAKKLGMKPGHLLHLINQPEYYWTLFEILPENIAVIENPRSLSIDLVHLFCYDFNELIKYTKPGVSLLKKNGSLWVSWPKGSSKIPTDLKRDLIRDHVLKLGLVDVKVAAIDENWSGLKFVYRLIDR